MRRAMLLLCTLATGCLSFDPPSLVQSLRVLGMAAEPAEVGSGEQAILRSLVVDLDPAAAGRAITYEWALCNKVPPPGIDVDDECYDLDTAPFITQLPTLPDGSSVVTMPMHTITDLGLPDSTGGFYVPVRLRVRAGNAMVTAFHRLRFRPGFLPPNHNPKLAGLAYIPTASDGELPDMGQMVDPQPLVEGMPLELPQGGKLRFRPSAEPGSAEAYVTFSGNITPGTDPSQIATRDVTELVRFFWYTSAGRIGDEITGEERPDSTLDTTEFTNTLKLRDGLVDLWIVAREERGGTDWLHRQIRLK